VVPPNWDSWGKIRVLRDGFDVESVSNGWSIDLDQPFPLPQTTENRGTDEEGGEITKAPEVEGSAVVYYEEQVQDSSLDALQLTQGNQDTTKLEVAPVDTQAFLANQLERLEQQKKQDDKAGKENSFKQGGSDDIISDHIGPVQFNMGGIQVDADDMVQRLKVCPSHAMLCW
jgi:dynein light intermediate chain 1, cytosolic